ncbi:hypothetical protein JD276_04475 [Leucobacter sp. CSA1]|uniref:Capsid maturation protease n=1 Tax=Leucobacter chromiisoli TaxID=2796471 RepID=A0A934Q613_9MICO|nr:hypothetical protein [Leucobacter chromiisoli]MBK0418286.1 hypothetical protein [Leucobacter chromiisoli]
MSIQSEAAYRFQNDAIRRSDQLTARVLRLWGRVPVDDLDGGWELVESEMVAAVSNVAVQNAASGGRMVSTVGRADGVASGDMVVPHAFAGIDGAGRDSAGLLHGAVTTTKEQIGRGVAPHSAFLAGASYLAAMTKTAVADLARSSAAVASAGRGYVRYIRVVNPGACDRCAILAGSDRFSKPFQRHPSCRCTSAPIRDGDATPDGLLASPEEHFASLSREEQDRIYGKAGAEAIRMGADPIQVVGARRGASGMSYSRANPRFPGQRLRMQRVQIGRNPDGSPIMGYTTIEGVTKRGVYGRAQMRVGEEFARVGNRHYSTAKRARLMPETIMELTNDPDLRRALLRDAGYLQTPLRDRSTNAWIQERLRQQQLDRVTADTFYRSLGIDLY